MAFKLKVGGAEVKPTPSAYAITDMPATQFEFSPDYAVANAWHAYASMCAERNVLLDLYDAYLELGEQIDSNENHPKRGKAIDKLGKLVAKIAKHQGEYMRHERIADYCWRSMSVATRDSEGPSLWFNTSAREKRLLGSWFTHFNGSDAPPREFKIEPLVLDFIPVEQRKAYIEQALGREFIESGV